MVLTQAAQSPQAIASRSVDYDVTIVGGGIVGLTLACSLKDSGLRIALMEARPKEAGFANRRAYAITLLSGRIFQRLGIWDEVLPQITTFQQIRLAEELHPEVVDLQPNDLGTPELGYVAEHGVLLRALHRCLEQCSTVDWLCPATVQSVRYESQQATLTVVSGDTVRQVTSRLVIAADGARSPIRQQAGIQTHGWKYWQSCITVVLRPEQSHQNIAREHFWASGPFATLPLPGNRCQIVLTAPHRQAQAWLEAPEAEFIAELQRRYQGQLGELEMVSDRQLFPVQLMYSDRYVQSRLALVGDAAHCCHPVGGQGMNLGIRDAAALAQVLTQAQQRGQDVGSLKILRRYERWRRLETLAILMFTDVLDRLFSNNWWWLRRLRRLGLWSMNRIWLVRHLSLRLMTGLSGRLPDLAQPGLNSTVDCS